MGKTAVVVVREVMEHHKTWGGAFAEGLRRHGWAVRVETSPRPCDMLVVWGARHAKRLQQQAGAGEVCVLERGYVGERFAFTSVSFGGGLNGRGIYRGTHGDGSRWSRLFSHHMKPWRTGGDYALIMEQMPGDTATMNVNLPEFYSKARAAFSTIMPVRTRAHPNVNPRHGQGAIDAARRSLQDDLAGAACVITWNSNAGVDAVLAGVPTVAMDEGSMAWAVTGHKLGEMPPRPDRTAWAHALAWKQWTRDEMHSGECWAAVGAS